MKQCCPKLFRKNCDTTLMSPITHVVPNHTQLLKTKASRPAIHGTLIALIAVIVANILVSFSEFNSVSIANLIAAQKSNAALWLLNIMPFAFAIWGQYISSLVAKEADTMIVDKTQDLWSQTRSLREHIEHNSQFDQLTSLPNRIKFKELLNEALKKAKSDKNKLSIVVLTLNSVSEINEILGYSHGDALIKDVVNSLKKNIPGSFLLSRLGNNEFAFIVPHRQRHVRLQKFSETIKQVFNKPFEADSLTLIMKTSMGAAEFPKDGGSVDTLLRHAYIASYVSKQKSEFFTAYSPDMDLKEFSDLHKISEVVNAIDQNELFLQYQPKLEADGVVREVEVLVRWMHPMHGMIPPDKFIPFIEKNKLNKELLQWVMTHALQQVVHWRESGVNLAVAINLSALDLLDSDLPDTIQTILTQTGVDARSLKLEITETTIMTDRERALDILKQVAGMDINTSIDDFGTGYSSLAYLSHLPAVELKIDRSFVMDMIENEHNSVIVKAIIDLAHNLSMKTVAEGVETEEIMNRLVELGCDYQQGYYISRPIDGSAMTEWIQKQNTL